VRVILHAVLVAGPIYALICILLYLAQDRLLYLPTPEVAHAGARALSIGRGAVTLRVWELHGAARPALIYFGGNAEDVGANIADFDAAFPARALYLVNYRGYGGSAGRPSETALTADAVAIYDSLRHIAEVHSPTLVVVAEHDEVVYRARSDALLAAIAPSLRHTVMVAGATHNDVSLNPLYLHSLSAFLYRAP
jgi:pimeloyl-ACP methyl ester carboxylesterase